MLQPKKCAICNTINDGSRHFCKKCGAFLSSAPVKQNKIQSVWEEEGGGGVVNDPFGTDSQDPLLNPDPLMYQDPLLNPDPYVDVQAGSGLQPGNNMQTGSTAAGGYIVRCPQCGKIHPLPDKKLPNVCSQCFYFFQPGVDKILPAASMTGSRNGQNSQKSHNSQNPQNIQNPYNGQGIQHGKGGINTGQGGNVRMNQGQGDSSGLGGIHTTRQAVHVRNNNNGQTVTGQGQMQRQTMQGQPIRSQTGQRQIGKRQQGQGPLAGRSALASSRPDDSRLMLLAISNKKMPPAEVSPQGDIIGDGGTIFRNLKTGVKLSLWHTPAGWYARAMQGNVLYNGLPMNVGFQKKLADGDMFSFDAGQFRVEIIG